MCIAFFSTNDPRRMYDLLGFVRHSTKAYAMFADDTLQILYNLIILTSESRGIIYLNTETLSGTLTSINASGFHLTLLKVILCYNSMITLPCKNKIKLRGNT